MQARLLAVQRGLLWLLAASLAIAVVTRPAPGNGRLVAAVNELKRLQADFTPREAERALTEQAVAQAARLSTPVGRPAGRPAGGPTGPKVVVAEGARTVRPLSSVSLATLADVAAYSRPGSTLSVGVVEMAALTDSLNWRFARSEKSGPFTVQAIDLVRADVSAEDLALERQVGAVRLESRDARLAMERSERRIVPIEQRVEIQAKRRRAQSLHKSRLELEEARTELLERTWARSRIEKRYEEAAQRAQRPHKVTGGGRVVERALARVTYAVGDEVATVDVPVPLGVHDVPVSSLRVTDFAAVRAASLWDRVKGGDAAAAVAHVEGLYNWHLRHVSLFGVRLTGWWVVAFLPGFLPCLLGLVLFRIRKAETAYSPFVTDVPSAPPPVGLDNRGFELVALVLLPLLAIVGAGWAQVADGQLPLGPGLSAIACLVLGGLAFTNLQDLRAQTVSIVRSNSYPPGRPTP